MIKSVTVIHETDGRKYFEALVHLQDCGEIEKLKFVGASVVWRFAHILLREKKTLAVAIKTCWENLKFRLGFLLKTQGQIVLICVGPWDVRLLLYSLLRFRNKVVYHTSWPFWTGDNVPRKVGPFTSWSKRSWIKFLGRKSVGIVAVTRDAAESVRLATCKLQEIAVIPHVVSDEFFTVRAKYRQPLRLLFVGDLIEKKGIRFLAELMRALDGEPVTIDLVGHGPLQSVAEELAARPGCRWHGRITSRSQLAEIVADAQVLVSPALRTARWEELFGMSILEAMASGLPCIVSDHSGPRSIISHGHDGVLVAEKDLVEFTSWIRHFIEKPTAWQSMSQNAVLTASRYSLTAVSTGWRTFLDSVQSGKPLVC